MKLFSARTPMKRVCIPRTDNFMALVNTRLRFILGRDVCLQEKYRGWETLDDERYKGACRPVAFDRGLLLVHHLGTDIYTVLAGDMADDHGRLIADECYRQIDMRAVEEKIHNYMEKNGIKTYNSEVGRHALWVKMMPQNFIAENVRFYELLKGLRK